MIPRILPWSVLVIVLLACAAGVQAVPIRYTYSGVFTSVLASEGLEEILPDPFLFAGDFTYNTEGSPTDQFGPATLITALGTPRDQDAIINASRVPDFPFLFARGGFFPVLEPGLAFWALDLTFDRPVTLAKPLPLAALSDARFSLTFEGERRSFFALCSGPECQFTIEVIPEPGTLLLLGSGLAGLLGYGWRRRGAPPKVT